MAIQINLHFSADRDGYKLLKPISVKRRAALEDIILVISAVSNKTKQDVAGKGRRLSHHT